MIQLALIGCGRIGYVHGTHVAHHPDAMLKYIVEPFESVQRNELLVKSGARLASLDQVLSDASVDGVIIASSTDSHAELLMACAHAGKAVFCEKPVSLDFTTTLSVAEQVRQSGIPCMLGFQRRYDPDFYRLKQLCTNGTVGEIEQIIITTRDPSPPPMEYVRHSGGMFKDQVIHDFDMVRFLLDEEIMQVYAVGGALINPDYADAGDIDTVSILLTSESGRFVSINNSRRGPLGYDQRLEILGSESVATVHNTPQHHVTIAHSKGTLTPPPENYFIERFEHAYRREVDAFVALIVSSEPPLAGILEGVEAQRLAEAAERSLRTGVPVRVSDITE